MLTDGWSFSLPPSKLKEEDSMEGYEHLNMQPCSKPLRLGELYPKAPDDDPQVPSLEDIKIQITLLNRKSTIVVQ